MGNVLTLLMARNIAQDDQSTVDYTFNIMYTIGDTEYIAQFMIMYVTLVVDQQIITVPLTTCDDFTLVVSPVQYNGTVPTFDCAITYKDLRLYSDASPTYIFDQHCSITSARTGTEPDLKGKRCLISTIQNFSMSQLVMSSMLAQLSLPISTTE